VNGAQTTNYVGDEYEVSPSGTVTKYIYISGLLLAKRVGNGTSAVTYWLHTDHEGSLNVETNASGIEICRQKYKAYGVQIQPTTNAQTPSGFTESRGYTAQRQDETGLLYLHERYYDPSLSRFISPDPILPGSETIGLNRYAYAGNDPVNFTD